MKSLFKASVLVAVFGISLGLGCSKLNWSNLDPNAQNGNTGSVAPDIRLSILDQQNATVFDDSAQSSIQLTSGQTYDFKIAITNSSSPYTLVANLSRIDLVNPGAPISISLVVGDNQVTAPVPGDYSFQIVPSDANGNAEPARSYQASITCANPLPLSVGSNPGFTFTQSQDNNFTFTAANLSVSGGQGPYFYALAAFGAQVTLFQSGLSFNTYNNYYGPLVQLGIIVKDSCNQSQTASATSNLGPIPSDLANQMHIYGDIVASSGTAVNYPDAVAGTLYVATNNSLATPVQAMFTPNGNGGATFDISSNMFKYLSTSVSFGINISIGGLVMTLSNGIPQSIDASRALLTAITYFTNPVSDGRAALLVSGGYCPPNSNCNGQNCTLTASAQLLQVSGTPCSASGSNSSPLSYTVQVSGTYSCTKLLSPDGLASADINGTILGKYNTVDNCNGGGGQGGGGIVPIQL